MKTEDFMLIMGAAVGVFLIAQASRAKAATTAPAGSKTNALPVSSDQGFGNLISTWNGWKYFDSGYVKDQFGNIYFQGEKIADAVWGGV